MNESIATQMEKLMKISNLTSNVTLIWLTIIISLSMMIYYFYYVGSIFTSGLKKRSCTKIESIYGSSNKYIQPIDTTTDEFQHPLRSYYIKTAYNACSTNTLANDYVDLCMLKNLLKQGVRCLDFEIYSIDDKPCVATSTDKNYFVKETFNHIDFKDVIAFVVMNAFNGECAPNPTDPIIFHFRFKSTNKKMYSNFAALLQKYSSRLLNRPYSFESNGENLGEMTIDKFGAKIIIAVDKSNDTFESVPEFTEFVNVSSNSLFMRMLRYYDIKNSSDTTELVNFNKQFLTIGLPDGGPNPENPNAIILRKLGIQMIAMHYSNQDSNIQENEQFFNNSGYAFVLKPPELRYKPVYIPDPEPPTVSLKKREVKGDFFNFEL